MTIEVVKTALSDVVLVDKGKGQSFVIPLTEIDRIYVELFKIRREYRPQIDEALAYRENQTTEIMRLLEPNYDVEPSSDGTVNVYGRKTPSDKEYRKKWYSSEFNQKWTDFEADMNHTQKHSYLELSQKNKQKAFEQWTRTEGEHCDYSQLVWYQRNYEK